jgi:hypothetical protein
MKLLSLPLILLLTLQACGSAAERPGALRSETVATAKDEPLWAAGGQEIWGKVGPGAPGPVLFPSPKGLSQIIGRWVEAREEGQEEPVLLEFSGAIGPHRMRLVPGVGSELVWNEREDAVLLSTSRAGLNGRWDAILVRRGGGRVEEHNPSAMIRKKFGHPVPVRCDWPEQANVGAVGWLANGNVLLAAQIIHHSVCDSHGLFRAYEVTGDGRRIVAEYDQVEAKRRFGPMIGRMIRDQDDRCVTRPEVCTVEYRRLHPEPPASSD